MFIEQMASQMANDFFAALEPFWVHVSLIMKPRGGIAIGAEAVREREDKDEDPSTRQWRP
jgi:NADPH-dependent 7-cyano-7-deazaguanine reductase QueF